MPVTYFSGRGIVYLARRDAAGNALAFTDVGNAPDFSFTLKTETKEHKESRSGQDLVDKRLTVGKSADVKVTLEEFSKDNLAMVLYGAHSVLAAGTVTDEAMPAGLVVGQFYGTTKQAISAVTIKDSTAATPVTLVKDVDYRIASPGGGMIEILNTGALVQPFKISYAHGDTTNINMFTGSAPERWVRFVGKNIADGNREVIVDLYRVTFDPLKNLDMIGSDLAKFELSGSVLMDTDKSNDAVMGQFGRIVQV